RRGNGRFLSSILQVHRGRLLVRAQGRASLRRLRNRGLNTQAVQSRQGAHDPAPSRPTAERRRGREPERNIGLVGISVFFLPCSCFSASIPVQPHAFEPPIQSLLDRTLLQRQPE